MQQEYEYDLCAEFRVNGDLHKPNGPAVIWANGDWDWWLFGMFHRYYGPVDADNEEWWIHDVRIK